MRSVTNDKCGHVGKLSLDGLVRDPTLPDPPTVVAILSKHKASQWLAR